jgi:hypothetical protein
MIACGGLFCLKLGMLKHRKLISPRGESIKGLRYVIAVIISCSSYQTIFSNRVLIAVRSIGQRYCTSDPTRISIELHCKCRYMFETQGAESGDREV